MKIEKVKVKKGALIGKYFKTLAQAESYYLRLSEAMQEHQSIVQFASGECLIVGNSTIEAMKI